MYVAKIGAEKYVIKRMPHSRLVVDRVSQTHGSDRELALPP
jgi:hypothetical protein